MVASPAARPAPGGAFTPLRFEEYHASRALRSRGATRALLRTDAIRTASQSARA